VIHLAAGAGAPLTGTHAVIGLTYAARHETSIKRRA
jgi:hypothetical protein